MSRFFQNFEEEKQEVKKKSTEIVEKSYEKLSKHDQKMKELSSKVDEVKNAGKTFEKLFKKLMGDLKKYKAFFENNEIPQFLDDLFEDSRAKNSKSNNSMVTEFKSQFNTNDNKIAIDHILSDKKSNIKKSKDLEIILKIIDDFEKEKELISYLNNPYDLDNINEAKIALFSIYSRTDKVDKMIEILMDIDFTVKNQYLKNICEKIDVFIEKIFKILIKNNDIDLNKEYISLLNHLKNVDLIDNSIIQGRIIEFEYLILNNSPENDHPIFKLLYFTKNKMWNEALLHFNSGIFDSINNYSMALVVSEFAKFAVENNEIELAFSSFLKCNETGFLDNKLELYALCVVLNEKLIDNQCFQDFIELFKKFDSNYLCLPSKDPFIEICRSFYYLNVLDYITASSIIEKTTGFQVLSQLEVSAQSIFNKKFVNK